MSETPQKSATDPAKNKTEPTQPGNVMKNITTGVQDVGSKAGKFVTEKVQGASDWVKDAGPWGVVGAVLTGMLGWWFGNAFGDGGLLGMVMGSVLAVGLGLAIGPSFGSTLQGWFGGDNSPKKDEPLRAQAVQPTKQPTQQQAQQPNQQQAQQQAQRVAQQYPQAPAYSYVPPQYTPAVPQEYYRGRP
jgi:hypothetical protein